MLFLILYFNLIDNNTLSSSKFVNQFMKCLCFLKSRGTMAYKTLVRYLYFRYWSITSPLRYLRRRTKKRALIMIGLAWLLSSTWLVPVLGWHHVQWGGVRQNKVNNIYTGIYHHFTPDLSKHYNVFRKMCA